MRRDATALGRGGRMTARLPIPVELQRLRWVSGQELRSRDFRDALANEAQMRWWHNRSKHDSYGIVRGLSVTLLTHPDGEEVLRVAPGLAYDCFGREVWVCSPRIVRFPRTSIDSPIESPADTPAEAPGGTPARTSAAGRAATLLLRAPEPRRGSPIPAHRDSGAFCPAPGLADCLGDEGELRWDADPTPDVRSGVLIAQVRREPDTGWTLNPVAFGARAAARARIGRGVTAPGATGWQPWIENDGQLFLGVETLVDTRTAGFIRTPCYFANFRDGWIPAPLARAFLTAGHFGIPVPLLHLSEPAPQRFRARVFMPLGSQLSAFGSAVQGLFRREIALCWMGIEPPPNDPCERKSP